MSVLPPVARSEVRRFTGSVATRIVLVAVALVPLLYAGALISANTDPTNRLSGVPAAIVNEDSPVTVTSGGQKSTVALGRVVAGELVSSTAKNNFDWTLTDARHAQQGLRDGTYLAVLTLPKNFSAKAASVGTASAASADVAKAAAATMRVTTNDGSNYISGNIAKSITAAVTDTTSSLVARNYLTGLYSGFTEAHQGMTQAASGAGKLGAGSDKLTSGAKSASSGASQLAAGANTLSSGLGVLAAGTPALSSGASQLATGADELNSSAPKLSSGAAQVAAGNQQVATNAPKLATGSSSVASGAKSLASGTEQLTSGAGSLSTGSSALSTGAGQLDSGLGALSQQTAGLPGQAATLAAGAAKVSTGSSDLSTALKGLATGASQADGAATAYVAAIGQLAQQCQGSGASAQFCAELSAAAGSSGAALTGATGQVATGAGAASSSASTLATGAAGVSAGTQTLSTGAQKLAAAVTTLKAGSSTLASSSQQLAAGAGKLSAATRQVAGGASQVAGGAAQVADGNAQLAASAPKLASGAKQVAEGNAQLAAKAPALASGADQLASGTAKVDAAAGSAATGASKLATGSAQLASGSNELYKGADQLSSGLGVLTDKLDAGARQVPSYSADQKKHLSSVAAQPVRSSTERLHAVGNYGDGLAPYFLSIALWVGAMSVYMVMRALPSRAVASNAPAWRVALAGYLPGVLMSIVQSVVMVGFVLLFIHVTPANLLGMFAVALFASLAFMAMNQALVAMLGTRGRFVALLLTVLQLAAAGATYPIQTAPWLWQALHPWLPLSYVVQAFRTMIAGGSMGLGVGWVVIGCWLVIGLLLTFLAAKKKRMWTVDRLHPSLSI